MEDGLTKAGIGMGRAKSCWLGGVWNGELTAFNGV